VRDTLLPIRFILGVLQLLRSSSGGQDELAIEIVMIRHEVAVFRRQLVRPALQPAIERCSLD
jgi:hypothetical protein